MAAPLLEARALSVWFPGRRRSLRQREWVRAVDGVSLAVMPGEVLALVGESGSGKTTLGRALVMLQRPTHGSVAYDGTDLAPLGGRALRGRRRLQMVFQDPYASLDPRQRVTDIVAEPLRILGVNAAQRRRRAAELLDLVGLDRDSGERLPREFSGGQRQRIAIARALAAEPKLIICDEPLSSLDVSVQAQIVNLLVRLQHQMGLTYVFISHDLAVVRQIADRVAVMYLGIIVEIADTEALFAAPRHPYTVALLSAVPTIAKRGVSAIPPVLLAGDPPSPARLPPGCRFHTRCWLRERLGNPTICVAESPSLVADGKHQAACHFAAETTPQSRQLEAPLSHEEEVASVVPSPAERGER
jgi:oligopeptide transport system ATP-binding protein